MSTIELDHRVVEGLRTVGGDALVRRMLRLFLVTSEEALSRMSSAAGNDALHAVQAAAHQLFSSAAQLRLAPVAQAAERLEKAARTGAADAVQGELAALRPMLDSASEAIRSILMDLPKPARITVVDDSEDIRMLLRLILERHYDVSEYATGSEALLGLRRFPADLVIIDVSLPDMSGMDLLSFIRADEEQPRIPAVVLTALSPQNPAAFIEAGFDMHLRKPIVDSDELLRCLHQLLEKNLV